MDTDGARPVLMTLDLTPDEARLVLLALRQFEPYWPADLDDLSRAALLAHIRESIESLSRTLTPAS